MIDDRAPLSGREPRRRDKERTRLALQLAIKMLKDNGLKISIAAVAAEVGVNPSLIHNTYPDLAEKIRAETGRSARQQRDEKAAQLAGARQEIKDVNEQLRQAIEDISKLASINESLRDEVALLRAQLTNKVRVIPRGRKK